MKSPRHTVKHDPLVSVEGQGDNHVTEMHDEVEPAAPPAPAPNDPPKGGDDAPEEQHHTVHGDIHPGNEVWR